MYASVFQAVEGEHLFKGSAGRLFITVSFGWLTIQLGRQLLPPLLPAIIEDLSISSAEAGAALSLLWGVYAFFQFPSGRLSDRLSRKTLLVVGLSVLSVGFLIVTVTRTYPGFLLGTIIVGFGAGLYPTAARALISDLFIDRRGQAFGIHTALGDLGNATAAGVAVIALAVATWQTAFLPVVVLIAIISFMIHLWSREPYVLTRVDVDFRPTARRLLANSRIRWLLVAYSLYTFTWQSAAGFLPAFLHITKGFSIAFSSTSFAVLFVVGASAKPISGLLGDYLGREFVAIATLTIASVGLAGLIIAESTLFIFLSVGIFAAGLMAFPPVMQAHLMNIFPTESMGGDLGAMRTIYVGLGSFGPAYVGYAAGIHSYTAAFTGLVCCLLISASIVVGLELRK